MFKFKNGKYCFTRGSVDFEVSKEVHDAHFQEARRKRCPTINSQANNVFLSNFSGLNMDDVQEALASPNPSDEEMLLISKFQKTLRKCINLLPQRERALLLAIYAEGDTKKSSGKKRGRSRTHRKK